MTTAPAIWHDDITINGKPYPTRHPLTADATSSSDCLSDLPDHQRQYLKAIHEAAHAVTGLATNATIHHAKVLPAANAAVRPTASGSTGGHVYACHFPTAQAHAAFLGAGERAANHWLRQTNLWTPLRAVGVELEAYGDRRCLLDANPHIGFGTSHDYRAVHDLADDHVTQNWAAITAVADALTTRLYLTGEQIAALAQLPNGTHSTTCSAARAA